MKLFLAISTILLFAIQNVKAVFVVKAGARNILECGELKFQFNQLGRLSFTNTGQVQVMVESYKPYEVKKDSTAYENEVEGLAWDLTQSAKKNTTVVLKIPISTTNSSGQSPQCERIWQESFYGKGTFTFVAKSEDGKVPAHMKVVIQLDSKKILVGKRRVNNPGHQLQDVYEVKQELDVYPTTPLEPENGSFLCLERITVDSKLLWFMGENRFEFNEENFTDEYYYVDAYMKQLTLLTVRYTNDSM